MTFDILSSLEIGLVHLCPVRNKNIKLTPEEVVRQSAIHHLTTKSGYPIEHIELEVAVGKWSRKKFPRLASYYTQFGGEDEWKGRADLAIGLQSNEIGQQVANVVIEFKRGNLSINDSGLEQLLDYAEHLQANWAQLTNGQETITLKKDAEDSGKYHRVERLPTYDELTEGYEGIRLPPKKIHVNHSWQELSSLDYQCSMDDSVNHVIGRLTPFRMRPYLLDLFFALQDTSTKIAIDTRQIGENISLQRDLNVRSYNQGTPGGTWNDISCRVLQLDQANGPTIFFGFGMSTWGGESSRLIVRTWDADGTNPAHHNLQLNLDEHFHPGAPTCSLTHNGTMTVGRGAAPRERVINGVARRRPELIRNSRVYLGEYAHADNRTALNQLTPMLESLIIYCMIRDQIRADIRHERTHS